MAHRSSPMQPRRLRGWLAASLALAAAGATLAAACSEDAAPASCATVGNGVCDEPQGTGTCPAGTDTADCATPSTTTGSGGGCPYVGDGVCDEPEGTGYCPEGTDPDCGAGGNGGTPATGGGGAGGGGALAGGGGSGGSAVVADVPCTKQQLPCGSGAVCCFHPQKASQDHCGLAGQCGDPYWELACNDAADCPGNEVCCKSFVDQAQTIPTFRCQATCEAPEQPVCTKAEDCASGVCEPWILSYAQYLICGL